MELNKFKIEKNVNLTIFGDWEITKCGDLLNSKKGYLIDKSRLMESDWIYHMNTKNWVNMNDFISAYFQALKNIGVSKLNILTGY